MAHQGWIGVDLDGTLAQYDGWKGPEHIGEPIPAMADRVRKWLAEGKDVRIFTARVWFPRHASDGRRWSEAMNAIFAIEQWCRENFGRTLPVTCEKDYGMVELWDDRAVQVIPNTGKRADGAE